MPRPFAPALQEKKKRAFFKKGRTLFQHSDYGHFLENKAAQISVACQFTYLLAHIIAIDLDGFAILIWRVE
ncbi:hypothetical protein GCM10007879_11120 [Maritalea porphyrae]|uniref:Uncharacterized protein n=1 Tax=Maritalea porphyrae TaxID=880732 RepID=A0ABQ5UNK0_9HYPH|nr:hypothetical protein GCM10007879_11120 [Maritalea porphyrae]